MNSGYFGIGVENIKTKSNIGTLWRSAYNLGADFIFTIGSRYKGQASDTVKAWRHIPFYQYENKEHFLSSRPHSCQLVGIEITDKAKELVNFLHPPRTIYILGAEDGSLTFLDKCQHIVKITTNECLNVAVAGSIVMYDRISKGLKK